MVNSRSVDANITDFADRLYDDGIAVDYAFHLMESLLLPGDDIGPVAQEQFSESYCVVKGGTVLVTKKGQKNRSLDKERAVAARITLV
jgi:hypothetical protein